MGPFFLRGGLFLRGLVVVIGELRAPTPFAFFFLRGVMGVLAAARRPVCMAFVSDRDALSAGCEGSDPTCLANCWLRRKDPTTP